MFWWCHGTLREGLTTPKVMPWWILTHCVAKLAEEAHEVSCLMKKPLKKYLEPTHMIYFGLHGGALLLVDMMYMVLVWWSWCLVYGAHDDALIYGNVDLEGFLHNNGRHAGWVYDWPKWPIMWSFDWTISYETWSWCVEAHKIWTSPHTCMEMMVLLWKLGTRSWTMEEALTIFLHVKWWTLALWSWFTLINFLIIWEQKSLFDR